MSASACLGRGRHLSLTQTAHLLCTDHIPEGDGWDYEPTPDESIKAIAEREGRSGFEVAYDIMMQNGGRGVIWRGFADVPAFYDDAKLNLLQ